MEQYESKQKQIFAPAAKIYPVISSFKSLRLVEEMIPQDKIQDLVIEDDFIECKIDGLGQRVCLRMLEREENKMVKFGLENMPMEMLFWVQLVQVNESDTRMKLTMRAQLPMMLKMMLGKKLEEGIEKAADVLAGLRYE